MIDDDVAHVTRELWEVGTRHNRTPEPTPEVDPWDDTDVHAVGDVVAVVAFEGRPSIVVRLGRGGDDSVTLDEVIDVDVPRADVPAFVESILTGQAWIRRAPVRAWVRWATALLGPGVPGYLQVPVPGGRVYTAPVPALIPSAWAAGLRVVEDVR